MKMLQLFASSGKAHFQFKAIVALEILASAIEGDESWHIDRQALLDIGRFEHRAAHGDGAMFRRDGEPDRRQRAGSAIGTNTAVDADAHLAPRRSLDFSFYGIVLAVSRAGAAQQRRRGEPSSSSYSCLLSRHFLLTLRLWRHIAQRVISFDAQSDCIERLPVDIILAA